MGVEKQIVETIGFRHLVNSSPKQSALELLQVQYHAIFTVAESTPFVYELGIVAVLAISCISNSADAILTGSRFKVQRLICHPEICDCVVVKVWLPFMACILRTLLPGTVSEVVRGICMNMEHGAT